MEQSLLNPVGRIDVDLTSFAQASQAQNAQAQSSQASSVHAQPAEEPTAGRSDEKQKPSEPNPTGQPSTKMDVSLRFKVDPKTNQVTIFVLNRASRQVVRTIPPDEMEKMTPGQIVQLFA